ncbi:MAG: DUF3576 domain-containing protein [Rhodobacteraceae bacterium]|nr:DUF3576 domain-containing protein [Paracoccaceae bacterium]
MTLSRLLNTSLILLVCVGVVACGGQRGGNNLFNGSIFNPDAPTGPVLGGQDAAVENYQKSSIWDIFGGTQGDQKVNVNRYLWAASLDVLSFLPVQSVDPFTGVIITGYGTPPGGGRSYRATVHIKDPALDARSLKVSLHSSGGRSVDPSTSRAVEDAILARARQIRIGDSKL